MKIRGAAAAAGTEAAVPAEAGTGKTVAEEEEEIEEDETIEQNLIVFVLKGLSKKQQVLCTKGHKVSDFLSWQSIS